jgi:hypothetical protein
LKKQQIIQVVLNNKKNIFSSGIASRSFLANNLRFMVKLIDKAIVINVKIPKNERKKLSSNKENLTC